MPTVRVTSKGQATLPKEYRQALGIRAPGEVVVRLEDGRIVVEPVRSLAETVAWGREAFRAGPTDAALARENARAERRGERRLERIGRRRR